MLSVLQKGAHRRGESHEAQAVLLLHRGEEARAQDLPPPRHSGSPGAELYQSQTPSPCLNCAQCQTMVLPPYVSAFYRRKHCFRAVNVRVAHLRALAAPRRPSRALMKAGAVLPKSASDTPKNVSDNGSPLNPSELYRREHGPRTGSDCLSRLPTCMWQRSATTQGGAAIGWTAEREGTWEGLKRTQIPPILLGVTGGHTRPFVGEVDRRAASAARERSAPGVVGC